MTEPSAAPAPARRIWPVQHPFQAVFTGILVLSLWYGFSDHSAPATSDAGTAAVMCEQFVGDHLKSPSTAEYDSTAFGAGRTWTVTGTVDSQNSFGAMVRNTYTCDLTYQGGDQWRLDALNGLSN